VSDKQFMQLSAQLFGLKTTPMAIVAEIERSRSGFSANRLWSELNAMHEHLENGLDETEFRVLCAESLNELLEEIGDIADGK
jgi:hypothetical protein